jgi:polyisoprenoid-binding protein YceI
MYRPALRSRLLWLALIVLLALPFPATRARAQQIVLELDPAQTHVEFTLDAFLHTVHGRMTVSQGKIAIDPATGQATGRIIVDARSAGTGNDGRDNRMHKDILESWKYTEITFTPAEIQGALALQGKSQVQLRGIINIHGREQEITVPVDVQITGNEWSGETTFPVPYVMWGLKNPSTFFLRVKDTVNLTVRATGRLSTAQP